MKNTIKYTQVSIEEAKELIKTKDLTFIDMRDSISYNESHIEGSIILTSKEIIKFIEEGAKTKPVMLVCYHGIGSVQLAQKLVEEGFYEVYSIEGGFEAWAENKD